MTVAATLLSALSVILKSLSPVLQYASVIVNSPAICPVASDCIIPLETPRSYFTTVPATPLAELVAPVITLAATNTPVLFPVFAVRAPSATPAP